MSVAGPTHYIVRIIMSIHLNLQQITAKLEKCLKSSNILISGIIHTGHAPKHKLSSFKLDRWKCIATTRAFLTHWGRDKMTDIFLTTYSKTFSWNEKRLISIKISLRFVPVGSINNIPALVQILVWRRPGDKPLSEPMMVSLLTHICVTQPQWVKASCYTENSAVCSRSYPTTKGISALHFLWNPLTTGEFPAQKSRNEKNVSMLWCHRI